MQGYSNPERENDEHALPDVEVFYVDYGLETIHNLSEQMLALPGSETIGWYWWACFPGCLPDGEPMGPFDSEAEALEDAQV